MSKNSILKKVVTELNKLIQLSGADQVNSNRVEAELFGHDGSEDCPVDWDDLVVCFSEGIVEVDRRGYVVDLAISFDWRYVKTYRVIEQGYT